jgi:hypothetical protein
MNKIDIRAALGLGAILFGGLLLLQNLGVVEDALPWLWSMIFFLSAVIFLLVFFSDRAYWWASIPGFILLGLATVSARPRVFPGAGGEAGGALFLVSVGISFWAIYFRNRAFWWALIPAGVITTTAVLTGLSPVIGEGSFSASILFFGMGLTFILVSWVQTPEGRMKWALIPGGILFLIGLVVAAEFANFLTYLWPAALLLAGIWVVYRAWRVRT